MSGERLSEERVSMNPSPEGKEGKTIVYQARSERASTLGPSSAPNLKQKGARGSPPSSAASRNGSRAASARSWAQEAQGIRRFRWKTSKATVEEVAMLEERFTQVVAF